MDTVRQRKGRPSLVLSGLVLIACGALLLGWSTLATQGATSSLRPGGQVPVTPADQSLNASNNSPMLAADPDEGQFLALANRLDAPDYGCSLHVSGDGGRGWVPVKPAPRLPAGAEKCYAPEVAFDGRGRLLYLFAGLAGRGNQPMGVFITTSSDRGRTFSPPRRVLGPDNFSVRMAVDPDSGPLGRIHLAWVHAASPTVVGGFGPPPNPIMAAHSDDGGKTFSKPVQVSDPERERVVAPALALGPGGRVHVAYYDLGDDAIDYQGLEGSTWEGTWSLVVANSHDGGRRFGAGRVAEARVVPTDRVMLVFTMPPPALVAGGDRVCVAWTDGRHGDADAFARCSGNRGSTWAAPKRMNDDKVGSGRSQYLPRLALSPSGRLDAIFYDRRDDDQNANNHVSYTFSRDGGRRFAPNVLLTGEGMSYSEIGQQYAVASAEGQFEFGSRLALLSGADELVAAWTDTHNSIPPTMAQDVFATVVTISDGDETPVGAVVAGVALLMAGSVVVWLGFRRRLTKKQPELQVVS